MSPTGRTGSSRAFNYKTHCFSYGIYRIAEQHFQTVRQERNIHQNSVNQFINVLL